MGGIYLAQTKVQAQRERECYDDHNRRQHEEQNAFPVPRFLSGGDGRAEDVVGDVGEVVAMEGVDLREVVVV